MNTAKDLMTQYSDGKQWAQENLLSEAAIDAAAGVLADGYWQHATPESKVIYRNHARAMLEAALKAGEYETGNPVSQPEQTKGLFVDMIASHGPEFVAEMAEIVIGENGEQQEQPRLGGLGGQQPVESTSGHFRGDSASLVGSILALVAMSDARVLVPHGLGGHTRTLLLAAVAALQATPQPSPTPLELMREYSNGKQWALEQQPKGLTDESLRDLIASHLTSTYVCTRVWSAWNVGTMDQDDFVEAVETELVEDLATAIEAKLKGGA